MPKLNNLLLGLVGLAILILVGMSVYEMFLKPRDEIPSGKIPSVSTYLGEDVLNFISTE